jgi:beta-mannosidase
VTVVPNGESLTIRAVSDLAEVLDLTVELRAVNMAGETRDLESGTVTLAPDAAMDVAEMPLAELAADEMLVMVWHSVDGAVSGGDVHAPKPYKGYDLLPPEIGMDVIKQGETYEITLSAQALALFVALEADLPGRFSHNAFTLFPGFDGAVTFTPEAPGAEPVFTIRDLHSATYGQPA